MNTNIRSATRMERARAKAVGWSAFLVVLMLTIAVAFTALILNAPGQDLLPDNGGEVTAPIAFAMPIQGTFTVMKEFSDTELQYNQTAKHWTGHKAYDLAADVGTPVMATYGGTVASVVSSSMWGTTVTLEHTGGLKTVYSGLENNVLVASGDIVTKGQRIGSVGNTAAIEELDAPHIHLEVYKNNVKVNPAEYINFIDK